MKASFRYPDKFLWLLWYPMIACSFIFIANDNPINQLMKIPSFVTDILFALTTTYLIGAYLKWITLQLDQSISRKHFEKRIKIQFIKGVIFPLAAAMLLEIFYLYAINIPFVETSILNLELPLALIFLISINTFYLASYLYYNCEHCSKS